MAHSSKFHQALDEKARRGMRIDVRLSAEDAAELKRIVDETGLKPTDAVRQSIRNFRQNPAKSRKSSRAREKQSFCIKDKIQIEPPIIPQGGYEKDHIFFNDSKFKSSWELYEQVREEMGKKISRAAYLALIEQCEEMGLENSKIALSNSTQGQYMRLLPPPDPKEKPRWAETEEEREARERSEYLAKVRENETRRQAGDSQGGRC